MHSGRNLRNLLSILKSATDSGATRPPDRDTTPVGLRNDNEPEGTSAADLDDQVKERISALSDMNLITMLTVSPDDYTPEALAFAKGEAQQRGLKDISVDAIAHMKQQEARQTAQPPPYIPEKDLSQARQLYRIGMDQKILQWLTLAVLVVSLLERLLPIDVYAIAGLKAVPGVIFIAGLIYQARLAVAVRCMAGLISIGIFLLTLLTGIILPIAVPNLPISSLAGLGYLMAFAIVMFGVTIRRATTILREAGLNVGIMGARTSQLKSLLEACQPPLDQEEQRDKGLREQEAKEGQPYLEPAARVPSPVRRNVGHSNERTIMIDDDEPDMPPPLPKAVTAPSAREISRKIPNGLGLLFVAISMSIVRYGKMKAALLAFFGYLFGAGIGYAIEALRIGRTVKMVLASVIGVLVCGGFFLNMVVSEARQMPADLGSPQTSSHAPTESSQSTADQMLQAFPNMSAQAKQAFRQKVSGMSDDQTLACVWQLMAEGETLFSAPDKNEMIAFYWKAVETLTPEEQMFVGQVNLKLSQGQGYSAADQQKSSTLVQKGFGNLSDKDNARYLELRGKAVELALLKPGAAARQFKSTYPPSESSVKTMTAEQKKQRMQELTAKAISLLPETDRTRFLELQLTPADQLTKAQYAERVKYSEKIMSMLSEGEMREMMELTAGMRGTQ